MASIISAGTTDSTSLNVSSDKTGILQLASNNAVTAVTIDTLQRVGIGTTSPTSTYRTSIKGDYSSIIGGVEFDNGGGDKMAVSFANATSPSFIFANQSSTGVLRFDTNATERMRIDSSGNVGIGTNSPTTYGASTKLAVVSSSTAGSWLVGGSNAGAYAYFSNNAQSATTNVFQIGQGWSSGSDNICFLNSNGANPLMFATNGSERMRIDSSGYVGVGTTSPASYAGLVCRKAVSGTWNGISSNASFTASDAIGSTFVISHSSANSYTNFLGTDAGGRLQMYCSGTGAGGVYLGNGGTSWTSASDERVKDIIEPIENGLTKVASLRAVIGKYKTDEEGTRRSFLIAQDVEAVLPEAVNYSNPDELGLSYTDVIPLLVASIKELKAINDTQAETINALTARLEALENK